MKRKALISGIAGQDGAYLAELLLEKDYEVFGLLRRNSIAENQDTRIAHLVDKIKTEYADVTDANSVQRVFELVRPDEVYNLAGQSHVRVSFDVPVFTTQVNALGAMHMLDMCRKIVPEARYYQASSSEMFGACVDGDRMQRETTPMHPVSPYGCAKLFAYSLTRHYRRAYKMFAANGILFNHSSPRRSSAFVEAKIVKTAVQIMRGHANELVLGNINACRDFGHSKDYVRAMHAILQDAVPDDFVVATGKTHTVEQICEYVFGRLNLPLDKYLKFDERYKRAEELPYLCGDASKIRRTLGWKPEYTFSSLLDDLIKHWLEVIPE